MTEKKYVTVESESGNRMRTTVEEAQILVRQAGHKIVGESAQSDKPASKATK